jgi:subtilase family serine protease
MMNMQRKTAKASTAVLAVLSAFGLCSSQAEAGPGTNVAKGLQLATDQGRVDSNKEQTLTVILKLHNQAAFDKAVDALYDPESASYHKWFTDADFARYAPTATELKAVTEELEKQGLSVVSTDPQNFSVRVHGNTTVVEKAFQTELHNFTYQKRTFQAHVREAQLTGAAGELVDTVAGLDRHAVHPQISFVQDPKTGKALYEKKVTAQDTAATLFNITGTPLSTATLYSLKALGTTSPVATYYGTVYNQGSPRQAVSYTPAQLQSHYGLTPLAKEGYDGTGQTIALVEAYGYDAAETDANLAAKTFGLPALTSKNYEVFYPEGKPLNSGAADLTNWTYEIALDIQAAHGIAPGAKIAVVASSGQDNEDLITSLQYIISHKLANTVSNSWENDDEIISGSDEENAFNSILKRGTAAGISFQFATGDKGDLGLGSPAGSVGIPSNSPYATAVGGTSILNDLNGTGQIVTGWGTVINVLDDVFIFDPPSPAFAGGAGGGESEFYAKPSWQKALKGTGRQVPDVSALADPYTGFPIIVTIEGSQLAIPGYGGTSLASPIFSAIWAIADQYNGSSLGFAAPAIAKLKTGEITDVVGTSDLQTGNPAGTIFDQNGATFYSALDLFAGASLGQTQTQFTSALWPQNFNDLFSIAFGVDTSLTVTPGWDNVTGFGEPNGLPFIQGVTGKTKGAAVAK